MNNINNIIYISSNLDRLEEKEERDSSSRVSKDSSKDGNNIINKQLLIDGIVYLPLSLEVYGWLRQQMDKAHAAYKAGRLAEDSWNGLRERFYPVHEYVVASYGKAAIENVLQTVQDNPFVITDQVAVKQSGTEPATEHIYPLGGDYVHVHPVSSESLAQVDAIRDKAINLGWAESQLYQNCGQFKFPYGSDYGIVCYLGSDSKIGEVTRQYVEIMGTSGKLSKFYNQNVDQPWIKKAASLS